jgi:hypothetical protein
MAIKNLRVLAPNPDEAQRIYDEYVSIGFDVDRNGLELMVLARRRPKVTPPKKKEVVSEDSPSTPSRKRGRTEQKPKGMNV